MVRKQVNPTTVTGGASQVLEGVRDRLGMTTNMTKVMAASPSVLSGYLDFSLALANGVLDAKFREQIALVVSIANQSEALLKMHSAIAKKIGMSEDEIRASQQCHSDDAKKTAALKFVSELVVWRGQVGRKIVRGMRNAGYGDAEIVEIAANAALVTLANCFECLASGLGDLAEPPGAA
jgi:AhpD family alkylhydroperoxidase